MGNMLTLFFGLVFPIFLSILIIKTQIVGNVPYDQIMSAYTSIFITMMLLIPLAISLIGYAANYTRELEENSPLRLRLFGISDTSILIAKMIANLIFLLVAIAIYTGVDLAFIYIYKPVLGAIFIQLAVVILIGAILILMAHSIANIFKKFGPTYAITMTLYFVFMIFGGMMGIQTSQFSHAVQQIAKIMPMTFISNTDYATFWQTGTYNFGPLALSFLGFFGVALVLFLISLFKNRRFSK